MNFSLEDRRLVIDTFICREETPPPPQPEKLYAVTIATCLVCKCGATFSDYRLDTLIWRLPPNFFIYPSFTSTSLLFAAPRVQRAAPLLVSSQSAAGQWHHPRMPCVAPSFTELCWIPDYIVNVCYGRLTFFNI